MVNVVCSVLLCCLFVLYHCYCGVDFVNVSCFMLCLGVISTFGLSV